VKKSPFDSVEKEGNVICVSAVAAERRTQTGTGDVGLTLQKTLNQSMLQFV